MFYNEQIDTKMINYAWFMSVPWIFLSFKDFKGETISLEKLNRFVDS